MDSNGHFWCFPVVWGWLLAEALPQAELEALHFGWSGMIGSILWANRSVVSMERRGKPTNSTGGHLLEVPGGPAC